MPLSTDDHESAANLSNWRTAPFNRWAFHNIRSILPVAEIENAPGRTLAFAETPIALDGFALRLPNGSSLDLAGFLKATATDGIVILHDNRIVYEFYDGGTSKDTPHILMSATKSIVGLIAGILLQRGELDIEAPVSRYVPEIAATAYRGATIRNLLDMRAGVVLDEDQQRAYALATAWEPAAPGETAGLHAFLAIMAARSATSPPTRICSVGRSNGRRDAVLPISRVPCSGNPWAPATRPISPVIAMARLAVPADGVQRCGISRALASSC
jgi:CubicO group peptidase (beta-lactamase class C family)